MRTHIRRMYSQIHVTAGSRFVDSTSLEAEMSRFDTPSIAAAMRRFLARSRSSMAVFHCGNDVLVILASLESYLCIMLSASTSHSWEPTGVQASIRRIPSLSVGLDKIVALRQKPRRKKSYIDTNKRNRCRCSYGSRRQHCLCLLFVYCSVCCYTVLCRQAHLYKATLGIN